MQHLFEKSCSFTSLLTPTAGTWRRFLPLPHPRWIQGSDPKTLISAGLRQALYDDDIFDGVPGLKNLTSKRYDDVFAKMSSSGNHASPPYNDLIDNLGRAMPEQKMEERSKDMKEHDFPSPSSPCLRKVRIRHQK